MRRILILAGVLSPAVSHAAFYNYAEFYALQYGMQGSVTGQLMTTPGNYINVSYGGHVVADTQINDAGSYYFTGYNGGSSPYVNSVVSNAPSRKDIISLAGQSSNIMTNTIWFSSPVTDPIMDIVSLGQQGLASNFDFSTPFTILSQGSGYFGGQSNGLSNPFGNRLQGLEGNGVIQFHGTFSSISFTASPAEYWGGFTVGIASVPEPGSLVALGAGLALFVRRRRLK